MKRLAAALLLGAAPGAVAASLPSYAGTWTFVARASDGTTLKQVVRVTQSVRQGRIYLSGYNIYGPLQNGTGGFSTTKRDADATRTYSGNLHFSGSSASGSGITREAYKDGQVVVTSYRISGRR